MRPLLLAAFAMLLASSAMARTSPLAGRPIPSRQSRFFVPFHVDARSPAPAEVRLYARDRLAGPWRLAARARPSDGRFDFSAPRDGQFSFSIRNVDARGREFPSGPHVAGLTVLVDTRVPTLQVVATSDVPGEVTVRWLGRDTNLDTSSLRIEYRSDPRSAWRAVVIGPAELRERRTTWRPGIERGTIELHAQVSDVAGNRAVWSGRVVLAATVASRPGSFRPGSTSQSPPPVGNSIDPLAANRQRRDGSVAWSEMNRDDAAPRRSVGSWVSQQQPIEITRRSDRGAAPGGSASPQNSSGVAPLSADFAARTHQLTRQDAASTLTNPAVRSVNTSQLEIEYDDQLVARSGGRVVQVWWTSDEGRTWRILDTDRDIRSPAVVTVDGEGTFGFRVVALGAREALGRRPQAGEQPEMMLRVDLTRPVVRIVSTRQTSAEVLDVQWQATDGRLAERPISLTYSVTPTGRRTSIAGGIADTGHYLWRFDGRVPDQFYLHVAAKDAAGNVGRATSRQPIALARRQRQGGAVRDVRPLGTSATRPRRYQFY